MSDDYKGDSWEKRVARIWYWDITKEELGARFFHGVHLVLASQDGGDVATLKAMGVRPDNIIACDMRASAIAVAKRRHGDDVHWFHGDVADAARKVGRRAASVFLDFCGQPTAGKLETTRRVIDACVSDGTVIGTEFARGRERKALMAKFAACKAACTTAAAVAASAGIGNPWATGAQKVVRCWERDGAILISEQTREEAEENEDGRSAYVFDQLWAHGLRTRCLTVAVAKCRYVGHRTPMEIVLRIAKRAHPSTDAGAFRTAWERWAKASSRRLQLGGRHQEIPHGFGRSLVALNDITSSDRPVAGAYNLSSQSLAAIRAHMTMGTYGTVRDLTERVTRAKSFLPSDADALRSHFWKVTDGDSVQVVIDGAVATFVIAALVRETGEDSSALLARAFTHGHEERGNEDALAWFIRRVGPWTPVVGPRDAEAA